VAGVLDGVLDLGLGALGKLLFELLVEQRVMSQIALESRNRIVKPYTELKTGYIQVNTSVLSQRGPRRCCRTHR